MATGQADTEQLAHLVQALPQELYDCIYNLTFTFKDGDVEIGKAYRPPQLLAVNRASRALAAASYYSIKTFYTSTRAYLARWLLSQPSAHLYHLRQVGYENMILEIAEVAQEARDVIRMLNDVGLGRRTKGIVWLAQMCVCHDDWEWVPLEKADFGIVYGETECLLHLVAKHP